MPSLLSDHPVRVAHYNMGLHGDKEYPVTVFASTLDKVYFWEPTIVSATEKPPTDHPHDRRRRVDKVIQWCVTTTWNFWVGAVFEFKRPDATPAEIKQAEAQVYDACERYLRNQPTGKCYGFSVFGSFWRVYLYEKPGARYTYITGEGPSTQEYYYNVTDSNEAMLIDSCFRDVREHMG
jgi:hypothetical protein